MTEITGRMGRKARWLAFAATMMAFAISAAPASAIMVKLPSGRYANYDAMSGANAPQKARNFDAAFTNLDYSGGPVMPSSTNYFVEWLPSNYTGTAFQGTSGYTYDYLGGMRRFFVDMAADSGRTTNSDAVATQYNDATGATSAYSFHYNDATNFLVDTHPLPANGCPAASGHICITDSQIQSELSTFLASQHVAHDLAHEYFLLTPPDVASCFDSAGSACSANADLSQAYCAYHSMTASGYIYSNIPDLTGNGGCDSFAAYGYSYDNGPGDGMLSAVSHEHVESITDPQPNNAWTDWGSSVGGEIGDKCNGDGLSDPNLNYLGFYDQPYNETINGDPYLIQREWSNQTKSCLDSFSANTTTASASFTMTSSSGSSATFSAAGSSSNPGGVAEYVWQFNDGVLGSQVNTVETTSPTITHSFAGGAGNYTVALTVMNADGTSNGTAKSVTVGGSSGTPPTARFTDSAPALEGMPVSFDGSTSSDPNAGGHLSYSWNWGDSTAAGTGASPIHAYSTYGSYTVTLTVTDSATGLTGSVSHTVSITDEAPSAAFSFSPGSPTAGAGVSFTGAASSDPDGHVTAWSWNYGDGSAAGTGSGPSHTYGSSGTYTVTLTITDSDGRHASVSHAITVSPASGPPSYTPPTAAFSAPSGLEGALLILDGRGSTDPNSGGTLSYAWNYGDGATGSGAVVGHAFQAGTWNVTLTVTDSLSGLSGSVSHLVVVSDEAPTAAFSAPSGRAGQSVAFSGTGSDADGSIIAWSWNFGDGTTASGAAPGHVYATPGTYTVTLTVVDSGGKTASVAHAVSIAARPVVCVVPGLKGKTLSQARKALFTAHCALGKAPAPKKKPKRSAGKGKHWALVVTKQSPVAGTMQPNGAKVALTLTYKAIRN